MDTAFIKIAVWTWNHYFSGEKSIQTELTVTEKQVRDHIERFTDLGASGNYDKNSLRREEIKVKKTKVKTTQV